MSYEINKSEIIQKFCENIDKPEKKCEGTCHLKKMMIDESHEEGNLPAIIIPEILLYFSSATSEMEINETPIVQYSEYKNNYTFKFLDDWVIPPKGWFNAQNQLIII